MHRLSNSQRRAVKEHLGNPEESTVFDLNDFLQDTRTNDYLFFKDNGAGGRRASSQCLTPKYRQRFEREVPLDKRREFLDEMNKLAWQAAAFFDNPQINRASNEFFDCCRVANQADVPGLRATPELKAATAKLVAAVKLVAAANPLNVQC